MCKGLSNHAHNDERDHVEIKRMLSKILDKIEGLEERIDELHGDLLDHIIDESFEYGEHEDHEHELDEDEDDECSCQDCHCE